MDLLSLVVDLGILATAVVLHEVGHGVVAHRCGDATAAEQGRLTLNPLRHVDPVGTVLVPGLLLGSAWLAGATPMLFGWAKPVPVDPSRMRHPRRDMALVAVAGPAVNFALAGVAVLALRWGLGIEGTLGGIVQSIAFTAVVTNCVLGVLNLLPILPLDGGRILTSLLPRALARRYVRLEAVGLLVVIVLLSQTSVLTTLVRPVVRTIVTVGTAGAGDER
jgi:Zn-dependent protease